MSYVHLNQARAASKASIKNERRRPNPQQGRALEVLGHAIEYLIDNGGTLSRADMEACSMLNLASRTVFMECAEVKSLHERMFGWLLRRQHTA